MTNYYRGLPVPKEIRDALNNEAEAADGPSTGITAPDVVTTSPLVLSNANLNQFIRVSSTNNDIDIEIPDTLVGGSADDLSTFEVTLEIEDATTNAVAISTGAGLLTPRYYGALNAITTDNSLVAITVVRGSAKVVIIEANVP